MKILVVCATRTAIDLALDLANSFPDVSFDLATDYAMEHNVQELQARENINLVLKDLPVLLGIGKYSHLVTFGCSTHRAHAKALKFSLIFKMIGKPRIDIQHGMLQLGYNLKPAPGSSVDHQLADHFCSHLEYGVLGPRDSRHGPGRKTIGIASNLHWDAYNDRERALFRNSIKMLCDTLPDYKFVWRLHPAEFRYSADQKPAFNSFGIASANLTILTAEQLEQRSADDFLSDVDLLFSSLSTMLLDAERRGVPALPFYSETLNEAMLQFESVRAPRYPRQVVEAVLKILSGDDDGYFRSGYSPRFDVEKFRALLKSAHKDGAESAIEEQIAIALQINSHMAQAN